MIQGEGWRDIPWATLAARRRSISTVTVFGWGADARAVRKPWPSLAAALEASAGATHHAHNSCASSIWSGQEFKQLVGILL